MVRLTCLGRTTSKPGWLAVSAALLPQHPLSITTGLCPAKPHCLAHEPSLLPDRILDDRRLHPQNSEQSPSLLTLQALDFHLLQLRVPTFKRSRRFFCTKTCESNPLDSRTILRFVLHQYLRIKSLGLEDNPEVLLAPLILSVLFVSALVP